MSETPGQVLHLMIERHALDDGDDTARIDWATANDAERDAWERVAAAFLAEVARRSCRICGAPGDDPEVTMMPDGGICTACALGEAT